MNYHIIPTKDIASTVEAQDRDEAMLLFMSTADIMLPELFQAVTEDEYYDMIEFGTMPVTSDTIQNEPVNDRWYQIAYGIIHAIASKNYAHPSPFDIVNMLQNECGCTEEELILLCDN